MRQPSSPRLRWLVGGPLAGPAVLLVGSFGPAAAAPSPSSPAPPAPSSTPASTAKITFGVQPASLVNGRPHPDPRPYLYYSATPGARLTDHVAILNYSTKPLVLNAYATDAVNTPDGGFGLLPAQTKPTDVGTWVRLGDGRTTYRVPPRTTDKAGRQVVGAVIVPLTVDVPAGATPGDHSGGIVVSLDTVAPNKQGARVRLDQRVGTRLFVRIAGPLHPALKVDALKVTYHGSLAPLGAGSATVTYRVRNAGNVKLGARQRLSLSGWFGSTGRVPKLADVPLLLPGGSVRERVEIPAVGPQFRLTAKVTLFPLQLQGDADPELPATNASSTTWAIPWTAVAIVLAGLIVALGLWLRRRRRAGRPRGRHGVKKPGAQAPAPIERDPVMHRSRLRNAAAAALLAATAWAACGPASADAVPFTDPSAAGAIGFCDKAGHAVTSGAIGAAPFAWRAVSDRPAPAPYAAPQGRASIFVYQPIQHVDPGDWSGKQLTAATLFTNSKVPMAQATVLDPALVDFTSVFKPYWDGLVQVRMFFSAPNQPQLVGSYPAAVLRVKGGSWTLVSGDTHPDCGAGKATSVETINLPKSVFDKATPRSTPGVTPSVSGSHGGSRSTRAGDGSSAAGGPAAPSGSATTSLAAADAAAAATHDSGSSGAAITLWSVAALMVVGAGGAIAWRRRGRAS